jgi:lambda repressor-like predicted transcriptional regulator
MDKKFIDWHSADIIAALRKKGHRWPPNRDEVD